MKKGGFKILERVLTYTQRPAPGMEEYLKQRSLSIMLCMNWVCAGVFDDHEWVSESTIAEQEEEVMGRELDYEICIPCVVQWCMLCFPRQHGLIKHWEEISKTKRYHEVVNIAIAEAISMPFWRFARTAYVHVDNSGSSPESGE